MAEKKVNLATELEFALEPVHKGVQSLPAFKGLLGHLGFQLPVLVEGLQTAASDLQGLINQVKVLAERPEGSPVAADLIALIDPIWDLVESLQAIRLVEPPKEWNLETELCSARWPSASWCSPL